MNLLNKIKSPLKDEKGFTLLEMIIAIAIMTIVLSGVYSFLVSSNRISIRINDDAKRQTAMDNAVQSIRSNLANAKEIEVVYLDDVDTTDEEYYYIYSVPGGDIKMHIPKAPQEVTLTPKNIPQNNSMMAVFSARGRDTNNRYSKVEVGLGIFYKDRVSAYFPTYDPEGMTSDQYMELWNSANGYITTYETTITMTPHNSHDIKFDIDVSSHMGAAIKYKMPQEVKVASPSPGGGGGGAGTPEPEPEEGTPGSIVMKWDQTGTSQPKTPIPAEGATTVTFNDTVKVSYTGTAAAGLINETITFPYDSSTVLEIQSISSGSAMGLSFKKSGTSSITLSGMTTLKSTDGELTIPVTITFKKAGVVESYEFKGSGSVTNAVSGTTQTATTNATLKNTGNVKLNAPFTSEQIDFAWDKEIISATAASTSPASTADVEIVNNKHSVKLTANDVASLESGESVNYVVSVVYATDADFPPISISTYFDTINVDTSKNWYYRTFNEYNQSQADGALSEGTAVTLEKNQTLKINSIDSWNGTVYDKTYDYLKDNGITQLWIQNGTVYETKPANWMYRDPVTQELTMKFIKSDETDNGDGTTTITGNIIGTTAVDLISGDHWTGTVTLTQEPKSVSSGTQSGKTVTFSGDITGTVNANDVAASINNFSYVIDTPTVPDNAREATGEFYNYNTDGDGIGHGAVYVYIPRGQIIPAGTPWYAEIAIPSGFKSVKIDGFGEFDAVNGKVKLSGTTDAETSQYNDASVMNRPNCTYYP